MMNTTQSTITRAYLRKVARNSDFDGFLHIVLDCIYRNRHTSQAKQLKDILGKRYTGFTMNVHRMYTNLREA